MVLGQAGTLLTQAEKSTAVLALSTAIKAAAVVSAAVAAAFLAAVSAALLIALLTPQGLQLVNPLHTALNYQ